MSEEQQELEETGPDADTEPAGETEQHESPHDASADTGHASEDETTSDEEDTDWKAESEKWKALARKHEDNAKGAEKVRGERDDLRAQLDERDAAHREAVSSLASERLHTRLARAGMPEADAAALIEHIDPQRLLHDGQPSTKAIDSLAASLSRSLTRGVDDDQGQASDTPPFSADQWLRKKAGR